MAHYNAISDDDFGNSCEMIDVEVSPMLPQVSVDLACWILIEAGSLWLLELKSGNSPGDLVVIDFRKRNNIGALGVLFDSAACRMRQMRGMSDTRR